MAVVPDAPRPWCRGNAAARGAHRIPTGIVIGGDDDAGPSFSQTEGDDGGTSIVISIGGEEPQKEWEPGKFDENLADGMDQMALDALCSFLLDGIDADIQSRKEWEETANRAAKFLGVTLQDPATHGQRGWHGYEGCGDMHAGVVHEAVGHGAGGIAAGGRSGEGAARRHPAAEDGGGPGADRGHGAQRRPWDG